MTLSTRSSVKNRANGEYLSLPALSGISLLGRTGVVAADSVVVAAAAFALFAYAISEKKSEICSKNSIRPFGRQGQFPLAEAASAFSLGSR